MVIVRMQGGLGNQLFQYALYERIKYNGTEVKADIADYLNGKDSRTYELDKLGIQPEIANREELHKYYADNLRLSDRICRYTIGRSRYRKEKNYDFEPWVINVKDGYLSGYWQSEQYFRDIAGHIRNSIRFQGIDSDQIRQYEEIFEACNSVSVHVRLGDYGEHTGLYGGICTSEYYQKAIRIISERVDNPRFFVFTDSVKEAEKLLQGYQYECVTVNRGPDSYKDMYLMSRCKSHIIANSTFSWWGAWLDEKPDKAVITPARWNHLCDGSEICCEGWIRA